MGLNSQEISQALQTLLSGVSIAQFREGTETVEVVVRAVPEERLSLDRLPDLSLFTSTAKRSRWRKLRRFLPSWKIPFCGVAIKNRC